MVLVVLVVVAWVVILGPSLLRRRAGGGDGISSISHFHHQLRVLEHSSPAPIVRPAYRLHAVKGDADGDGNPGGRSAEEAPVLTVVGAKELPRPALAFLGEQTDRSGTDRSGVATTESRSAGTGAQVSATDLPTPWRSPTAPPAVSTRGVDPYARQLAHRRRRDTLGILVLAFVVSLLAGFIPGASVLWSVTGLSGLALVAYVALLVHLRRRAEEREHKLRYLSPDRSSEWSSVGSDRPATRMGGRYAHPSNGAAAVR